MKCPKCGSSSTDRIDNLFPVTEKGLVELLYACKKCNYEWWRLYRFDLEEESAKYYS